MARTAITDSGDVAGTDTRSRTVLNWSLALAGLLGAAALVIFAYVMVLGTAGCGDRDCPRMGPGEVGFTLIVYGAPVVSVLAVVLSFVTARRRRGVVVPAVAWALLLIGFAVLILTFP